MAEEQGENTPKPRPFFTRSIGRWIRAGTILLAAARPASPPQITPPQPVPHEAAAPENSNRSNPLPSDVIQAIEQWKADQPSQRQGYQPTLYDVYLTDDYPEAHEQLEDAELNYEGHIVQEAKDSHLVQEFFKTITVNEMLEMGTADSNDMDDKYDAFIESYLGKARAKTPNKSLLEFMDEDAAMAAHIRTQTQGLMSSSPSPRLVQMRRNIPIKDLIDTDGTVNIEYAKDRVRSAIAGLPANQMYSLGLSEVTNFINLNSTIKNDKTGDEEHIRLDFKEDDKKFIKAATNTTIGDFLIEGELKVSNTSLDEGIDKSEQEYKRNVREGFKTLAEDGFTVYEALRTEHDSSSATSSYIHSNQPSKFLATGTLNEAMAIHLEQVPLSAVLDPDGQLNHDKLRTEMIRPLKDLTMREFHTLAGKEAFQVVLGDEVAALPLLSDDSRKNEIMNTVKMELFLDERGSQVRRIAENFEQAAVPSHERAAAAIAHIHNPWHQFEDADGVTRIPFTFDIANNPMSKAEQKEYNPQELTQEEKKYARYAVGTLQNGINVQFVEVGKLPVIDDKPQGITFSKGDPSKVSVYGGKRTAAGIASGAVKREHDRVDILVSPDQTKRPDLWLHEIGHALGLSHDFDSKFGITLPGSVANELQQKSPGITVLVTMMSYAPEYSGSKPIPTITPMLADREALEKMYGAAPLNQGDTTYTLRVGTIDDMVKHGVDPTVIWVHPDTMEEYLQTLKDTGGKNTLDVSTLDGKPVVMYSAADLHEKTQFLDIRPPGMENSEELVAPHTIRLGLDGEFHNVIVHNGVILGNVEANELTVKESGDIEANGGDDTIKVGSHETTITPGEGSDTIILRASEKAVGNNPNDRNDFVWGFNINEDRIVVPESFTTVNSEPYIDLSGKEIGTRLNFLDEKGNRVRVVDLEGISVDQVPNIKVETKEGEALTPSLENLAKALGTKIRQSGQNPASDSSNPSRATRQTGAQR